MVLTVEAVLISSPLKSIWPTSVPQNRREVSCRVTYDSATVNISVFIEQNNKNKQQNFINKKIK